MNLIIRILAVAGAVWLADYLSVGIRVANYWPTAVIVAVVLGLLSFFVKPIISFFALDIQRADNCLKGSPGLRAAGGAVCLTSADQGDAQLGASVG